MSQLIDSSLARQFDRLPPHSIESEMCVLASMMLDASPGRQVVGQILQLVNEESFFQADHSILFGILKRIYETDRPIDAMIVREELIKRGMLEEIGGLEYLAHILNTVPSAANGAHYAGTVREKALLRQVIAASSDTLRDAYAPHESAQQIIETAQKRIFEVAQQQTGKMRTHALGDLLIEVYEASESKERGIETGYYELDETLNGLTNGEMIVLAARPSMGKTAIATNIIENVACVNKIPCAIFSLEMSGRQLAARILCSQSRIDAQKLRRGMLTVADYQHLSKVISQINEAPIFVEDPGRLSPTDLRVRARELRMREDVRLFMLDYIQLMDASGVSQRREEQVSEISRTIKSLAREMNVPFIALSQLNRSVESREGHRPRMSDLRESGSIEQDADTILLLHREDYYRQSDPDYIPDNIAEVIIAKQRNGPIGTVKLTFNNRCTRFENLSTQTDPY